MSIADMRWWRQASAQRYSAYPFNGYTVRATDLHRARCSDTHTLTRAEVVTLIACGVVNFRGVDVRGVDFTAADLSGCIFSGADMSGCNFTGADLHDCDLSGADLDGVVGLDPKECPDCDRTHCDGQERCNNCQESYHECDSCSREVHGDDANWVGGSVVCQRCLDRNYFHCDGCNEYHPNDTGVDRGDETYCSGCDPGDQSPILGYTDDSANYLGPFGDGPLWFGIELEVQCRGDEEDHALEVLDRIGDDFAVCKHDGSLTDGPGFEIVTARSDIEEHRKRFKRLLGTPLTGCRSFQTRTCGMHVHMSRNAMTPLQIGKMLVFLNEPGNKLFVEAVAGRRANHYCKISKKKIVPQANYESNCDRYQALNLTNYHTVEVRIFKGTLLYEGVMRNLDFCACLVDFTKTTGIKSLRWEDFVAHVQRTPKVWPFLTMWMRAKGYLPSTAKQPQNQREEV